MRLKIRDYVEDKAKDVYFQVCGKGIYVMCDGLYICCLKHNGKFELYDASGFKIDKKASK